MSRDKKLSNMLHKSSMKPFMDLEVSLMQTHNGDSVGLECH